MDVGLIILAGGRSSRMGTNKALLTFGAREETTVERILYNLGAVCKSKLLVTNEPALFANLPINMVRDNYPGLGPMAGIEAGLSHSPYDLNLVIACDMPFVQCEMAEHLISKAPGYDAVVPMIKNRIHPLFALYRKSMLPKIKEALEAQTLRMVSLLEQVNVCYVKETELLNLENVDRALFNMNQPIDYEKAKSMLTSKDFL
ncbi:molybdenum cofactor guanylyltransferase [Ammoniphilus sp. YIM 78166]|uniref:molybdenum cofactor guanylyltransferase n=1 Tax=Ammoniphilus sp. YIM 78166 TaxID=1644106 RepID=UPI0010701317|nr:molybdenum cofactor guanylyltransferase [Ammoniphilus sp. YIM 78166]